MKLVLLVNPRSGRGRSAHRVSALLDALIGAEHGVSVLAPGGPLQARLEGADALIVAGGDGSVHYAAPVAARAGVPIVHYPLGTENLFAREFGHRARPEDCVATLATGRVRRVDLATVNQRPFVLMLSCGFDASVVHRVAEARGRGVSRLDYMRRIAGLFPSHTPPRLSVEADGRAMAQEEPGLVIVANSRHYAARLNPALEADVTDGRLDVVFIPARGVMGLAKVGAALALGMALQSDQVRAARAESVLVQAHDAADVQVDGEAVREDSRMDIRVDAGALGVLIPP